MKKNTRAFTMIELLMVMVITSVLGAVALPHFIDFRNEARASALQQNLAALRVALKNQKLQAKLKCNYNGSGLEDIGDTAAFYLNMNYLWGLAILQNNVTLGYLFTHICTTAQIPNPPDRKFMQDGLPRNPFASPANPPYIYVIDELWASVFPTPCAAAAFCMSVGGGVSFADWSMNVLTGEIYACSDTPGVNECSF